MKGFFTGHRYIDWTWKEKINQLIDIATEQGVNEYYIGMAIGTDLTAAECLTERHLKWTAVLPCKNQDKLWKIKERNHYAKVLKSAHKQIILYPEYSLGCMQARNHWMVNHSDICLAVYDGRPTGGTALTVQMAFCRNLPIIAINPMNNQLVMHKSQFTQLSLF